MNYSQSLDVLIGITGCLFILSVANEAMLEFLKFLMDLKVWGDYDRAPSRFAIGQRFWYPAVHSVLQSVAARMKSAIDPKKPRTAAETEAARTRIAGIREELKGLLGAGVSGADYAAEAIANVSERQVVAAVDAYIAGQKYSLSKTASASDVGRAKQDLENAKPAIASLVASAYGLKKKAMQNRQRGYSFLTGLLLGSVLFGLNVFSLYSLACLLTVDPAARAAAAAWFSDENRVNAVKQQFDAAEKGLEASVDAVQARAESLNQMARHDADTKELQSLIAEIGKLRDTVKEAPKRLGDRASAALAGAPSVGRGGFAAPNDDYRPAWGNKTEKGMKGPGWWLFTVLELLVLALVLTFGAENWHNILNALLEARRQFGEGKSESPVDPES